MLTSPARHRITRVAHTGSCVAAAVATFVAVAGGTAPGVAVWGALAAAGQAFATWHRNRTLRPGWVRVQLVIPGLPRHRGGTVMAADDAWRTAASAETIHVRIIDIAAKETP